MTPSTGILRRSPHPGESFDAYRERMAVEAQPRQQAMWAAFLATDRGDTGSNDNGLEK